MNKDDTSDDKKGGLPRIIVLDDEIIVLDEDWVEKNIEKDKFEYVESAVPDERIFLGSLEKAIKKNSDISVVESEHSDTQDSREERISYSPNKNFEDMYDPAMYEPKEIITKDNDFFDAESARRGGRSALEIAGFKDVEAEKKRKSKYWVS